MVESLLQQRGTFLTPFYQDLQEDGANYLHLQSGATVPQSDSSEPVLLRSELEFQLA